MASEKLLERKCCEAVRSAGGQALKLLAVNFTGLPDRLMLLPGGLAVFVEFKSTGEGLRDRQKLVRGIIEKLGFRYEVIDTKDLLTKFISEL